MGEERGHKGEEEFSRALASSMGWTSKCGPFLNSQSEQRGSPDARRVLEPVVTSVGLRRSLQLKVLPRDGTTGTGQGGRGPAAKQEGKGEKAPKKAPSDVKGVKTHLGLAEGSGAEASFEHLAGSRSTVPPGAPVRPRLPRRPLALAACGAAGTAGGGDGWSRPPAQMAPQRPLCAAAAAGRFRAGRAARSARGRLPAQAPLPGGPRSSSSARPGRRCPVPGARCPVPGAARLRPPRASPAPAARGPAPPRCIGRDGRAGSANGGGCCWARLRARGASERGGGGEAPVPVPAPVAVAAAAPGAAGRAPMGSPSAAPRLLYRSTRLLRAAFQQLHQQQQRGDVFCDVVLRAEGEAVVAHCCVLSVCSPFFMEQLGRELPPRGGRVVLELGGVKIRALRKLVHFLYTAELDATWEEVQEVLAAARRLQVTELESLQLQGGRLVRPGPQRQLNRSCLRSTRHCSPPAAGSSAEPGGADTPLGRTSVSPQESADAPPLHSPEPMHRSPVQPVKLRKVKSRGCWEVVQERQPPSTVAMGDGGVMDPQPTLGADAEGQADRHCTWAAWKKQCQGCTTPQQGCGLVPPEDPPGDPEEEEVDVGTLELCLPPDTVCVWPCPSSDEEVDVLT
ncbi:BTB/POZ domain-containing protein 18 [Lathamus discolor]|uniref:BTB/POZ domain-containing protein 18 n=1 Tax=Lathamus discolor TaxID=678569 RepID=UPI0032B7882C